MPPRRTSHSSGRLPARPPQLPPDLQQRLAADPLFRLTAKDGSAWIDPFTGRSVAVAGDLVAAAGRHLLASGSWRGREVLPRAELEQARWRLDLPELLRQDRRFRLLDAAHGWLAPCCGVQVEGVQTEEGKITARTADGMAAHLARCPQAQAGVLLSAAELLARHRRIRGVDEAARETDREAQADLDQAVRVQRHMMATLPEIPGWDFALHYTGQTGVSGDFYEFAPLPDGRLLVVLADVTGHGMQAALVATTALTALRFLAREGLALPDLIERFSDELRGDLLPSQFVTCFVGILDPAERTFECLCAGHHPALIANLGGRVILRQVGLPGVGLGLLTGADLRARLKSERVVLEPGDILLQFSDGLTEARGPAGELFGEERLYGALLTGPGTSLQDRIDAIVGQVVSFTGGKRSDDLTVLALSFRGG